MNSSRLFWTGLALLAGLVAGSVGCEELEPLDPQDQAITLTLAAGTCDAPRAIVVNDICYETDTLLGSAALIGTAFDENDGSAAEGVTLSFTADRGMLDSETAVTDVSGRACVTVNAPHEAGDPPVNVQALHPNGQTTGATLAWPPTPGMFNLVDGVLDVDPDGTPDGILDPEVNPEDMMPEFSFFITPSVVCRLSRLDAVVTYDPAFMEFVEAVRTPDGLELTNPNDPTMDINTVLNATDNGMGQVTIEYFQDDPDAIGLNRSGNFNLVSLIFRPIAVGATEIGLTSYTLTGLNGVPYNSVSVDPIPFNNIDRAPSGP